MSYKFDFAFLADKWPAFVAGAWLTIQLTILAIALGFVVGTMCAIARVYGRPLLRRLVGAYVEVIRNTPFLVQIFFLYFGLPTIGIRLDPNTAALLALVVNFGAYGTEIIRAGIESIHKGQLEAGTALGLSRLQIFRYVVMKPALRTVYPALTSQFIYLMLTSSVVSVISATDLAAAGNDLQSQTFASFEVYLVVTAIYLALAVGFSAIFAAIQRAAFTYPMSR